MGDDSNETLEEFFEDFSGWEITDEELEGMLNDARADSDIRLRRLIKQHQYFRFLIPHLIEIAEWVEGDNQFVELAKSAVRMEGNKENDRRKESVRTEKDTSR